MQIIQNYLILKRHSTQTHCNSLMYEHCKWKCSII